MFDRVQFQTGCKVEHIIYFIILLSDRVPNVGERKKKMYTNYYIMQNASGGYGTGVKKKKKRISNGILLSTRLQNDVISYGKCNEKMKQ